MELDVFVSKDDYLVVVHGGEDAEEKISLNGQILDIEE